MSLFYDRQPKELKNLYIQLLSITASLSNLYADTQIPFIYYRAMENIFCKSFEADNLSRSDISADASKNGLGIGLKTFLQNNGNSFQKIAEFNKESYLLKDLNELDKVIKVSEMRNERILSTMRICNLNNMIYHLLTRSQNKLLLFEEEMSLVNIDNIKIQKQINKNTIHFTDGLHDYSFSLSKNTLLKRFITNSSNTIKEFNVEILNDPYEFLLEAFYNEKDLFTKENNISKFNEYIILPLYSPKTNIVQEKSGLNQWNASGRIRNNNEVYIPVPSWIHKKISNFFNYNTNDYKTEAFDVILPNKKILSMKIAQQGGKSLMSNPNSALGQWILRDVLKIPQKTLVTKKMLDIIGIDSVKLTKIKNNLYNLDFLKLGSYEKFEEEFNN